LAYSDLENIRERVKRLINQEVISGTHTNTDLEYYIQDANLMVDLDYPSFGSYAITIGSDISPSPSNTDAILLSLKAASLAYTAIAVASVADAIMVKAGSISLDTSRSLKGHSEIMNKFGGAYKDLIDRLFIDANAASTCGYRLDSYLEVESQENSEDSDSLWA